MPQVIGTYEIALDASQASWTEGPIFQTGQSARVQASGSAVWGQENLTPASVPATFDIPASPIEEDGVFTPSSTIQFWIPQGQYSGAEWSIQGDPPQPVLDDNLTVQTGSYNYSVLGVLSGGTFSFTGAATPGQVSDINAAQGGWLTVGVSSGQIASTVSAFTLSLTPAAVAFAEGTYPPTFANSDPKDPAEALQDWQGSALVEPALTPVSVIGLVAPDGSPPTFGSGLYPHAVLQPNQDTTFSAADLVQAGATEPETNYRLWFIFNDGTSDFSAATGSFELTLTIYGEINMADPLVSLIRPQFAVETSYASGGSATRVLNCCENSGFDLNPEQTKESRGLAGIGFNTDTDLTTEMSKGSFKGWIDFRDLPYLLQSQYGNLASANPTSGVYNWTSEDMPWANNQPQSYAFETPTAAGERAQAVSGLIFDGIKIETERDKQYSLNATLIAKILADNATPSSGANSVQVVTLNGTPTGGSFILVCDNVPTASIAYNATSTVMQTAIRAVGGSYAAATVAGSGPWTITIPTGGPVPLIQAVYTNASGASTLTGGTTPTVTVAQTTMGGMQIHPSNKVLPGTLALYFAPDIVSLVNSPTLVASNFSTSLDLAERYAPVWRQNPTDVGHGYVAQKKASEIKDSASLTMAYNAQVATFVNNSRSGTKMYVRLAWVGPEIGTSGYNFQVFFDAAATVTWKSNKDSQGNIRSVDFDLEINMDVASGFRSRWTVQNDVASYSS